MQPDEVKPSVDVGRQNVKAMPASKSEAPNGAPSEGPSEELGMTAVVDNALQQQAEGETVRMQKDGQEVDIGVGDVVIHERSGWKRLDKEEGV